MKPLREQLFELAEEKYKKFQSRLCPGVHNIIGVRVPHLRKIAREIAKSDWRTYLKEANEEYYEECMVTGMVIGYAKADIDEILEYISQFVPKIDNWAVCDSFCTGLKITKKHKNQVWDFLQPYLFSEKEYHIRFGVVMLLSYYIDDEYIDQVLSILDSIKHEGYYVKMAVAWAISVCYVKFEKKTFDYLKDNTLDDFTYNKAIQKIIESLKVDKETKDRLKKMKRKKS